MFKVRILNQNEIKEILSIGDAIDAVESVYAMKAEGKTDLFPMVSHEFEVGISDFDIKSGAISGKGIYGMKTVSYFSENAEKGLPNLAGISTIYDITTGFPIGIMEASYITGLRTGAAGALGCKYLARKDSESLLLVGAGKQSIFQIAATLYTMTNIKKVMIFDLLNHENAVSLAEKLPQLLIDDFQLDVKDRIEFTGINNIEEATKLSDIIITTTPARAPIIMKAWVKEGTHFSCMGSDVSGKQEIDGNIMATARIFVDDKAQCIKVGEIELSLKAGIINEASILGEIGQVIVGDVKGRTNQGEITVFDSTGLALQDLIVADKVLDIAKNKNIGIIVDL